MRTAERIRYLVLAVQREGNRQLIAGLRPLGITPAQSEALRILGDHAPMTLTDVGRMLVCESGTNPSRIIDRLVDSGIRLVSAQPTALSLSHYFTARTRVAPRSPVGLTHFATGPTSLALLPERVPTNRRQLA